MSDRTCGRCGAEFDFPCHLERHINGKEFEGVGESKIDVKSTFIELQDETIPFEKSSFSTGLKKALQDAISQF
jgi:hypothetical protein